MSPLKNRRSRRRERNAIVTAGVGAKSNASPSQKTMRSGNSPAPSRVRSASRKRCRSDIAADAARPRSSTQ
jgi:hypothetical protein